MIQNFYPNFNVFHIPQDDSTPLYRASFAGRTDIVQVLLQYKADPNISNKVSFRYHDLYWHVVKHRSKNKCVVIRDSMFNKLIPPYTLQHIARWFPLV